MNLSRDLVKNVTQASFMLKTQWWSAIRANKTSAEEMVTNARRGVSLQCAWNVVNATTAIWWLAPKENQISLVHYLLFVTAATVKNLKKTVFGGTAKIVTMQSVKSVFHRTIDEKFSYLKT